MNIDIQSLATSTLVTIAIAFLCLVLWRLISRGLSSLEKNSRISQKMLLPIRLGLRYGLAIAGLLFAISAFGIPIGNFWTFLSTILGLVAIGFVAVWSVLSNISSTFFIIGLKPFSVGDDINLEGTDIEGKVMNLDFMFTTIRKTNGDVFKIPNNLFFQKAILLQRPEPPKKRKPAAPEPSVALSDAS